LERLFLLEAPISDGVGRKISYAGPSFYFRGGAMSFFRERASVKFYVLALTFLGFYLLFRYQPVLNEPQTAKLLFFMLIVMAAEQFQVAMPWRESYVSVGFALILAAILIFGPVAAWPAAIGQITLKDIKFSPRYFYRTFFNVAQIAVCTVAAAEVYLYLGGVPEEIVFPRNLLAIIATCIVYFLLNVSFMVIVLSLSQNTSALKLWALNFKWVLPNYLALSPLGVLVALLYVQVGTPGVLLLFLPLLLARHTFMQYTEMRNTYLSTIKAFVKAIDAKDKYTSGHSERVAYYAVEIGRELRLSEEKLEKLEYLALLHDIGKIAVAESVLNKKGKLIAEELNLIRAHPQIGANIVEGIKFIGSDANIIRYHHEWVNGRGYPAGIDGEKIPLGAKIVSVADAFDAMTSKRVYRDAMSVEKAVEELRRCSGTQFDPQIVEALVKVLRRKGEYSG
jgi:putative nucleotidyltransferase with HDIG domain